jgi:predicted glycosyltransferase
MGPRRAPDAVPRGDLATAELLRAAALRSPDVVLVDHMPHGAMGELFIPTLEALRPTGARFCWGWRDILDAPEVVRRRWSVEGGYEAVDRHYDSVLVYGSRGGLRSADRVRLARRRRVPTHVLRIRELAARLRCRRAAGAIPAAGRPDRRSPGGKLVVATRGGADASSGAPGCWPRCPTSSPNTSAGS